ncbi:aldehyde dehydrogenase family protein [Yinghuangia sp. YIM S09857]|uniref:aldehyde dehydrogenase family protein n=1 Tax=Yinghuangia sp. YIM S09857 TaxID=3436929 RepID=UPI003F52F46A
MSAAAESTLSPALPPARDLVAGAWRDCADELPDLMLEDPSTGDVLGPGHASGPDRVEQALAAAADLAADGAWARTGTRADVLDAVAEAVDAKLSDIAALEAFATGVPIAQTRLLGVVTSGSFRLAASQLRDGVLRDDPTRPDGRAVQVHRLPLGPALCLVPWNAPAPMAAHKVASALAAGCPVILKPSEFAPYGSQLLAQTVAEVFADRGLPDACFQFLHGDGVTGAALAADPRIRAVSFTGGARGGVAVGRSCAERLAPAQLELGGCNPLIVMPDADVAHAAAMAADLLTTLNGQWCRALGRLVVPAARYEPLLDAIGAELAALRVGESTDEATEYGPLVHSAHRALVRDEAAKLASMDGAKALSWTRVPERGNHLPPMLITGVPPAAAPDEIFGPVATVHTYTDLDEAVNIANTGSFGLEGYVAGTDEERALAVAARVRAGEVKVNGSSVMSLHMDTPRPAWGMSGLGEEGTVETLRFFTGARVVGTENHLALHRRTPERGA